jgi:hypothetical protein
MRIIRWLLVCSTLLALGQAADSRIAVTDVAFDEAGHTLKLNLANQGSAAITGYHLLVTQDCPEGKINGTDAVMRFLTVLQPEEIGDWYQSASGNTPIRPQDSRKISFRLDRRETSQGPCSGANMRAVTVVFADGTSEGSPEVVQQILDHRRGESSQYTKWLEPLRTALAADEPHTALAKLRDEIESAEPNLPDASDDRVSGAGSAHRDIFSRARQLARLYEQRGSDASEIGDKILRLHELRAEALARY